MDFITARLPSMHFATSRISKAALALVGASCSQPKLEGRTAAATERRSDVATGLADRRRTPSGADDQHLYTVNI